MQKFHKQQQSKWNLLVEEQKEKYVLIINIHNWNEINNRHNSKKEAQKFHQFFTVQNFYILFFIKQNKVSSMTRRERRSWEIYITERWIPYVLTLNAKLWCAVIIIKRQRSVVKVGASNKMIDRMLEGEIAWW